MPVCKSNIAGLRELTDWLHEHQSIRKASTQPITKEDLFIPPVPDGT